MDWEKGSGRLWILEWRPGLDPRVVDIVNPTLFLLSTTICAKLASWAFPVKFPRNIPSLKRLHRRGCLLHRYNVHRNKW